MKSSRHRRRAWWLVALGALISTAALSAFVFRPDRALRVGTGVVSEALCGGVFVSKLDPQRVFAEDVAPNRGLQLLRRHLHYAVDRDAQTVSTTWLGHFRSVAHFEVGYGCTLGDSTVPPRTAVAPLDSPSEPPLEPGSAALQAALAHAFEEPAKPPYRHVRAIVIMRDGKIIAERYAPGVDLDTPLLGYSASKSVINALVGILVREHRLDIHARAPVKAWEHADDPRRAITPDQLMRMTSGLDLTEDDSGFDPVSRMLFLEPDMAGFATQAKLKAKPGTQWEYTSGNTLIVSAIVRDLVGGHASDVLRFARHELFEPLGMHHTIMEFDQAGTPIGATRIFASARDWARFGQLYLDDGVAGGRRILPPGWVAYSTRQTLGSDYAAGFWIDAGGNENAQWRVRHGMPADTFYASGLNGQRVVVVPSHHLVIARLGSTIDPPTFDIRGLARLVSEVIATEKPTPPMTQ
jgi:CubicO group peptidase (beta-lactamase class C family)